MRVLIECSAKEQGPFRHEKDQFSKVLCMKPNLMAVFKVFEKIKYFWNQV